MSAQSKELRQRVEAQNRHRAIPKLFQQQQWHLLVVALLISDAIMLALAFGLAYWLRFVAEITVVTEFTISLEFYRRVVLVLVPCYLALFGLFDLYELENLLGGTAEYAQVFNACTVAIMGVVLFTFLAPTFVIARGWLVMAWLVTFLFVAGARFGIRRLVYRLRRLGYYVVPALIVGSNPEAQALAQQLMTWTTSGLMVLGFASDGQATTEQEDLNLPVLGNLASIPDLVSRYKVEELVVASSAIRPNQLLDLFRRYGFNGDGVNLRLSSGLFDILNTGLTVKSLAYVPLISAEKVRLSRFERFLKGILDYGGAVCGLLVLSPFLALIALAIKLDSPGPVIYRRRVLGRGGKPFDAFKFRSMHVAGDDMLTSQQWAELQAEHKLKDDPRVTRVGRTLRRFSLDELPQLVNVLKGQMSLVGPRMITGPEKAKYGQWDMNLLTVKPGLSGLWQVSGRADVGYEERVRLDMYYIRNYTIWLDLQLILRTIGVVIRGRGAY